jgi:hypothetical protein
VVSPPDVFTQQFRGFDGGVDGGEGGGWRMKEGGQRTEDGGQRTDWRIEEGGGRKEEGGGGGVPVISNQVAEDSS